MIVRDDGKVTSESSHGESSTSSEYKSRNTLGNLCSIIIDEGSCVNVASERLLEKLALPILVHPRPYRLQWLSEHIKLVLNRQVEVAFTLGSYEDKVLCDVVPMEATHLLSGCLKPLSPKETQEDQNKMIEKRKRKGGRLRREKMK
ncbi:hypothetical protein CR513_38020, partial [Mucuna pruriens]